MQRRHKRRVSSILRHRLQLKELSQLSLESKLDHEPSKPSTHENELSKLRVSAVDQQQPSLQWWQHKKVAFMRRD
jgi:hypothetical protein